MVQEIRPIRTGRPVMWLGAVLSLVFALMMLYMPYQFQSGKHRYLYDWLQPLGAVFLGAFILQALTLAQLGLSGWLGMAGHILFAGGILVIVVAYQFSIGILGSIGYLVVLLTYLLALAIPRRETLLFRMMYGILLLLNGGVLIGYRLLQPTSPAAQLPGWVDPMFLVPGVLMCVVPWLRRRWSGADWAALGTTVIPIVWFLKLTFSQRTWLDLAVHTAMLVGVAAEAYFLCRPSQVTAQGLRKKILALTLGVAVVPTIGLGAYSVYNVQMEAHLRALETLRTAAENLNWNIDRLLAENGGAPLAPQQVAERFQEDVAKEQMTITIDRSAALPPTAAESLEVLEENTPTGGRRLVARIGRPDLPFQIILAQPAAAAYSKAANHAASLLLGTLVTAGIAVAAGTLLSSRLNRRLTALRQAIAAVGQERYDLRATEQEQQGDEVDLVSATLREMAVRLQEESKRRETEHRRLSTVLRMLPVGVFLARPDGRLYQVNEAGQKMWGTEDAPLVGPDAWKQTYTVRDPVTGRELSLEERSMYRAMQGEERLHQEAAIDTFDGQRRTLLQSAVPVRDEYGTIVDIVATAVDITEQKANEALLRASEALLSEKREILEMVAVGKPLGDILTAVARFAEKRVGGGFCEIFLVEESGLHIRLAAAPSLPPSFYRPAEQMSVLPGVCVSGPAVARKEIVICEDIAADPTWREYGEIVLAHGLRAAWSRPILNAHGEALGTITTFYPEPKRPSEEDLKVVETATYMASIAIERDRVEQGRGQKLESLLQNMAEGVIAVDENRRLLFINPAARRLLGVPEEETAARPWADLLPGLLAAKLERTADPGAYEAEKVTFTCGGRDLEADLSPVYSAFGRFGALAVIRDITEQLKFRRLQESFVANASHELRGPLASISATLEAIVDGVIPEVERQRYLRALLEEMARLRRLSYDVIDLTRLDTGVVDLIPEPIALDDLLQAAADRAGHRAAEGGIRLRVTCDRIMAHADPDRTEQVITNLVDNAIRFTPPGGEIHLEAAVEENMVRVRVADTGVGIAEEHLPYIFERFYKADPARTLRRGSGTGLGLAIARQLIERMGGTIHAASVVGQGTTISFTLPLIHFDYDRTLSQGSAGRPSN